MSDILTFEELKGNIKDKTIAWIGDGNNVANSFIEAATKFQFKLKIACPKKYQPDSNVIKSAKKNKCELLITDDPYKAAKDADCIMTDKWISMSDKGDKNKKKKILKKFKEIGFIAHIKENILILSWIVSNSSKLISNENTLYLK